MYFNTFMDFPYYTVHGTLAASGLLLRNLSGDVITIPNDNGLLVNIPDFSQSEAVDL